MSNHPKIILQNKVEVALHDPSKVIGRIHNSSSSIFRLSVMLNSVTDFHAAPLRRTIQRPVKLFSSQYLQQVRPPHNSRPPEKQRERTERKRGREREEREKKKRKRWKGQKEEADGGSERERREKRTGHRDRREREGEGRKGGRQRQNNNGQSSDEDTKIGMQQFRTRG